MFIYDRLETRVLRPVARIFKGGFRNVTWVHKIGNGPYFYKSNYSCIFMYCNIMCSTRA